jgi:hypothetical protein
LRFRTVKIKEMLCKCKALKLKAVVSKIMNKMLCFTKKEPRRVYSQR